jgi:CheY-like chemotaxis protein
VRLLENQGPEVHVVEDGHSAIAAVPTESLDLVLMDVKTSVLFGVEATAMIREHEASAGARRTPIIALTAHTGNADRERCRQAGMDEFLAKAIRAETLRAVLVR